MMSQRLEKEGEQQQMASLAIPRDPMRERDLNGGISHSEHAPLSRGTAS
jgi:hypothetical protein